MNPDDLNAFGRFALFSKAIKLDKNNDIKVRMLHPLGIVFMTMSFVITISMKLIEGLIEFKYFAEKQATLW